MTVVKVIAPNSFASFCVAMNIPFVFNYGTYFITNTKYPDKVKAFCLRNGLREQDLAKMQFSVGEIELNIDPE